MQELLKQNLFEYMKAIAEGWFFFLFLRLLRVDFINFSDFFDKKLDLRIKKRSGPIIAKKKILIF